MYLTISLFSNKINYRNSYSNEYDRGYYNDPQPKIPDMNIIDLLNTVCVASNIFKCNSYIMPTSVKRKRQATFSCRISKINRFTVIIYFTPCFIK